MNAWPRMVLSSVAATLLASHGGAQSSCNALTRGQDYFVFRDRALNGLYRTQGLPIQPSATNPIIVKLRFHSLHSTGTPFALQHAANMVSVANQAFAAQPQFGLPHSGIQFVFDGLTADQEAYLSNILDPEHFWLIMNTYRTPGAIDVFLVESMLANFASPNAGFSSDSICPRGQGIILDTGFTPNGSLYGGLDVTSVWIHEIGHYFDLFHPWEEWQSPTTYFPDCPGDTVNCGRTGDFVCDTAAAPDITGYPFITSFFNNCTYSPQPASLANAVVTQPRATCPGVIYSPPPDVDNYMGNGPWSCRVRFTAGQLERMFAALVNFRRELYEGCFAFENALACTPRFEYGASAGYSVAISQFTHEPGIGAMAAETVVDFGTGGAVHVLSGSFAGDLEYESTLMPDDGVFRDRFGYGMAFDGTNLVIGAPGVEPSCNCDASEMPGKAYFYRRENGTYELVGEFEQGDCNARMFGYSVDVYGNWAVVGAPGRPASTPQCPLAHHSNEERGGAVYVYKWIAASQQWELRQRLLSPEINAGQTLPGHSGMQFGARVKLSGDFLAVAGRYGSWEQNRSGAVFMYETDGTSFQLTQTLSTTDTTPNFASFGYDIDLWENTLAITDRNYEPNRVLLFEYQGSTWINTFAVESPETGFYDRFGFSIALAGNSLIVGHDYAGNRGAVFEYARHPVDGWVLVRRIDGPPSTGTQANEQSYGVRVNTNGPHFIVGDPYFEDLTGRGAAFVYGVQGVPSGLTGTSSGFTVSGSNGGQVTMTFDFGIGAAGRPYAVYGTTSGPVPGFDYVSPVHQQPTVDSVPHIAFHSVVTPDWYTFWNGSVPVGPARVGIVNAQGRAIVRFRWVGGWRPDLIGKEYLHTAVLTDDRHYESNPVIITVTGSNPPDGPYIEEQ